MNLPNDPFRGTIQLPVRAFDVNYKACKHLKPAPGIVYVEMAPYEEKRGALFLADETQQRERADAGVVLACGLEREKKEDVQPWREMDIRPGDRVLVEPYRGTWLKGAKFGDYEAKGWVRVYGLASGNWDEYHPTDWRSAILATYDETKENSIRATGKWLFIERDKIEESAGGVILTERSQKQSGLATIISVGSSAYKAGYREGMRIQFPPGLTFDAGLYEVSHAKEFGLDSENCAFLDFRNVLAVID